MGFWSDLKNANPHRSVKRGRELAECDKQSIIEIPYVMKDHVKECAVCKVQFGQMFAKNTVPFLITLAYGEVVSFATSDQMVVCGRCISTFNLWENIRGN